MGTKFYWKGPKFCWNSPKFCWNSVNFFWKYCIYLPPISYANQKKLRGIGDDEKLFIRCSQVKIVKVPHIKGLEVSNIRQFGNENGNILDYLPEYVYSKEPNRVWIWNLVNTLAYEKFQKFILHRISQRETELTKNMNLNVRVISEIVDIIKKLKPYQHAKTNLTFYWDL